MQVLLAVVEDLYTFAVSMLFPRRTHSKDSYAPLYLPESRVISPHRESVDLQVVEEEVVDEVSQPSEKAVEKETPSTVFPRSTGVPQKNTLAYCARASVPLHMTPDTTSDTVIATISYGDMVMLLDVTGDYSYVAVGNKKGYMLTSSLVQKAADVYPDFLVGADNSARKTTTMRLRLIIHDEFGAGVTDLPLQAHEYVYYKLLRRGTHIVWPDVRPRTPGTWTRILGPLDGVTISDMPTAGSILEFTAPKGKPEERPHLAYVEKVLPGGKIQVSEANWPDRGVYNERVLEESEWHNVKTSFISIT